MSNEQTRSHGVMEGKGAYNRYAKLPAGGGALALPLLENAVRNVTLDEGDQTVVIADYGSSQGKNSVVPMQVAIKGLRRRVGSSRPISVYTLTNRRTTSTCYSLFWMLTRTDTSWTTQTYFRVRSEDHSTRAFSRPARFILVGPRTPRCG